ncbi:patatin-like phospholipase family protein [Neptuniibacter caesariensis]|uniref:PNPLA domain-containing protein n=1 Tax=Neptuniibacter caesariensis TaxID=207954 RepID=A0A7U8C7H6_NEPCE|nr:patatin-like phospholipase family protein [Neptuniibacter caesariensis]EAR61326.1 hypothetical protein MED92_11384 [Oceanospirillum sp. MED92] [Neptuniibacter caesariensis]
MGTSVFTQNARVLEHIEQIKLISQSKRFSDIQDAEGFQYVDLVMEGGGVLGLALVGYTYALEQAGIRFRSTAGTSAGAINALFLQVVGAPNEAKSTHMVKVVADMPMAEFQDGNPAGKLAVSGMLEGSVVMPVIFSVFGGVLSDLGLNPGLRFHQWVTDSMKQYGIRNWAQLKAQMNIPIDGLAKCDEEGFAETPVSEESWSPQLKVVAAEVSTTTKLTLPEPDGELLYLDIDEANPADFVRASMSVPVFFEPYRIKGLPRSKFIKEEWEKRGHSGTVPDEAVFIDGGVISNFPIAAFHTQASIPRMPTFGIKLGVEKGEPTKIDSLVKLFGGTVSLMRSDADDEFIRANPDYKQVVKEIPTGHHHWLNFSLEDDAKVDLFARGVEAAKEFLQTFDWENYKQTRAALLKA